jgi:hypothetical protein
MHDGRLPLVVGLYPNLERFETTTRTNWHYECVSAYIDADRASSDKRR